MTVNKVILIGNLGRDPEVRSTAGGTSVANLNIATTERRKDRDGNWADHTEWHRVVAFGNTAENVGKFLKKGRQVYIEGKLSTRKYTDKDGVEKYSTEVVADAVRFLGSGEGGGGRAQGGGGGGAPSGGGGGGGGRQDDYPPAESGSYGGGSHGDDDIPF